MTWHKFFVGFVLAVAMVLVLGTDAVLFAVRDFQYGLAQFAPTTGGLVDDEALARSERAAGDDARNTTRLSLVHDIADIEARSQSRPATNVAADVSAATLSQRIESLATQAPLNAEDNARIAAMRIQAAQLSDAEAPNASAEDKSTAIQHLLGSATPQAVAGTVTPLQQYQAFSRVHQERQALQLMSPFGVAAHLAGAHPAQLSIALVMLMGALGALLYLFPAYLTRPVPVTVAEVLVRLIFGACAALAFYILANATVAGFALSDSVHEATSSAGLNPFSVSLIGIVAGVLAEDIAKWIQERGKGIFTPGAAAAAAGDTAFTGVNPHGGPDAP